MVRHVVTVAATVLLVLALPATAVAHGGRDGDYRWVDGDGPAATGRTAVLPVGVAAELWTPDLQAALSLPAEALVDRSGTGQVVASLVPVDAAGLGAPPTGLAVASNAYRVAVDLHAPGTVVLATPHEPVVVLYSPAGDSWRPLRHRSLPDGRVTATMTSAGYVMAATDGAHLGARVEPAAVAGGIGLLLLLIGLRRRRVVAAA